LWWIPTQKDAKTQFLVPWHPTVAATNNLMTALYFSSEMSGLWPGPGPKKSVEKLAAAPDATVHALGFASGMQPRATLRRQKMQATSSSKHCSWGSENPRSGTL
jgi:hypothetical protein